MLIRVHTDGVGFTELSSDGDVKGCLTDCVFVFQVFAVVRKDELNHFEETVLEELDEG